MKSLIIIFSGVCFSLYGAAQQKPGNPDFPAASSFQVVNRQVSLSVNSGKSIIHLDAKPNAGIAWINVLSLETGIIEFDVKGKNVIQQSFVGVAFHGQNDSTYEAIYFRPINFQSPDTLRRKHSVQYISLPEYDWPLLREKYPAKYENNLLKAPDPEAWFHVKIVVGRESIEAYLNDDRQASLVVKPIRNSINGKIGFWVGNNSDGDFSNLSVQNRK